MRGRAFPGNPKNRAGQSPTAGPLLPTVRLYRPLFQFRSRPAAPATVGAIGLSAIILPTLGLISTPPAGTDAAAPNGAKIATPAPPRPRLPPAEQPHEPSFHRYDVIVIGGGHAAPKPRWPRPTGVRTLLLTHNIETVGAMSCNPAIGGIGKGHLVRNRRPRWCDGACRGPCRIQWRTLNASKGPAVRHPLPGRPQPVPHGDPRHR